MAFKDTWKPRIDGIDDADSSAVNEIAEEVIRLGEEGMGGKINAYTKEEADNKFATKEEVGDIETALDGIIAIQKELIGGDGV